jgi:arsenate reductase (glutaredoxin)
MTAPPIVHGISHCDTVKRARAWFAAQGVAVVFHDYGKSGLPPGALDRWLQAQGWERLLNRRGTTWRRLDAATQAAVVDGASAAALMAAHTSVIKRPVVEWPDGAITVGFDAAEFARRC